MVWPYGAYVLSVYGDLACLSVCMVLYVCGLGYLCVSVFFCFVDVVVI